MERYRNIPVLSRKLFVDTMLVLINAELADSVCSVVDGVIVGRFLGSDALAAFGLASSIYILLGIFIYMLTVGFQQACTVSIGRGEDRKANGLYSIALFITLVFSLLFTGVGLFIPQHIARWLGAPASGPVLDMTVQYLIPVIPGVTPLLLFLMLIPVLQIEGKRRLIHLGCAVMAVADIVLDLLNVKVFHGGMWGMGLATSLSYGLGLLVLLTYYFSNKRFFHFRWRDMSQVLVRYLFREGLPSGIRVGATALATVLVSIFVMNHAGASAMAALSVQRNILYILLSVAIGVSGSALLLTGLSYGEEDRQGLMDTVRISAYTTILWVGVVSVLVFVLAPAITSLYLKTTDPSYQMGVSAVRWLAVSMPMLTWVRSMGNYWQGIEKTARALGIFVCGEFVYLLLCVYGMGYLWGTDGIFAAFAVSQLILILTLNVYSYLKRDKRYKGMEAFLGVDPGFGVPPDHRLLREVTSLDEVWTLSEQAQAFCLERGLSAKKAYWVSLFIEEMGNIILTYAFADGKTHHLEIRLSISKGDAILHFRDDCRRFDIREKAAHWKEDPEHPETTLGIRIVMQASKSLSYSNSMNTNNLLVKI